MSILLVEDDTACAHAMTRLLGRFNNEVRTVPTVKEAITLLNSHHYDFVLLDIMLPDGDGTDVFAHIKNERINTRVIVCTGMADGDKLSRIIEMQPDAVFPKPIDVKRLLTLLVK